ncbi:hypothetical protein ACGRHY_27225 [Streptomyces sp. HK10]|uniref:hypothetical protein n=1 Tax=Streptomyces sp. HK10 TaxID=3373255 RepID=UPI0037480061
MTTDQRQTSATSADGTLATPADISTSGSEQTTPAPAGVSHDAVADGRHNPSEHAAGEPITAPATHPAAATQGRSAPSQTAESRWWDDLYWSQDADLDTNTGNRPAQNPAAGQTQHPAAEPDPGPAPAPVEDGDGEDAVSSDADHASLGEVQNADPTWQRPWQLVHKEAPQAPVAPAGTIEAAIRSAALEQSGWHVNRIWWVLRWGTPALLGWGFGLIALIGDQLAGFHGRAEAWLWIIAIPAIPCGLLAWRARAFWPPLGWVCRIPLATLIVTAVVHTPVERRADTERPHMDGHVVVLAADLGGGLNLGTITAAGLAAIMTAFCVLYLKSGGNNKYVRWVNTEILIVLGFASSSFYESAGWVGPSNLILQLSSAPAASWGYGALAVIITLFLFMRNHSDLRAVIGGFTASTLFAAAGGSWAWPETLLTILAQAIGLV